MIQTVTLEMSCAVTHGSDSDSLQNTLDSIILPESTHTLSGTDISDIISLSHVKSGTILSNIYFIMIGSASSSGGSTTSISAVYDIGKLLVTKVNLHNLNRTQVHFGKGTKSRSIHAVFANSN